MTEEPKALIKAEDVGGDLVKHSDDAFQSATQSGDYLPRLQLMTANSDKCKGGDFPTNHYALVRDQNFQDLGPEVDVLIVTWRPKALEIGDELISVFDQTNPEFKRIQDKSFEADSGCMFGPEFLVYIPSVQAFATFFMGSKSSRREAGSVKAKLQGAGTLKSKKVSTKRYTWYTPLITACSTPIDLPDQEELTAEVTKFNNPPETTIEKAEKTDEEKRAR